MSFFCKKMSSVEYSNELFDSSTSRYQAIVLTMSAYCRNMVSVKYKAELPNLSSFVNKVNFSSR